MITAVVDSGATKTHWAFIHNNSVQEFITAGMNPSVNNQHPRLENTELVDWLKKTDQLHYFGAGINSDTTKESIAIFLSDYLSPTAAVSIENDLLGAAIAATQGQKGIVVILGTGSNSCIYDGKKIIDAIPSLGYTLSDEGSGNKIGKEVLKAYFYRRMPTAEVQRFEQLYSITKEEVIHNLYKEPAPNAYLASFAGFAINSPDETWKESILMPIFEEMVNVRIKSFTDYPTFDVYFVGSISYFCRDWLERVMHSHQLKIANIVKDPMQGLIDYYKQ